MDGKSYHVVTKSYRWVPMLASCGDEGWEATFQGVPRVDEQEGQESTPLVLWIHPWNNVLKCFILLFRAIKGCLRPVDHLGTIIELNDY